MFKSLSVINKTTINYSLDEEATASIEILDALQRTVMKPLNQHKQDAGAYTIVVPISQLITGTYSVRLTTVSSNGNIRRAVQQIIIVH